MLAEEARAERDVAECKGILARGSKSFSAASALLPARVRVPATVLYAFCRVADDLVDAGDQRADRAIDALRLRLDRTYAGRPIDHAVDRALERVVDRFSLPRALPDALIEGFSWDADGRRYADLGGVYAYSARVAAVVGVMMTVLMGDRRPETLARACDLGVAMQLTNIARDVGEDAANGRIYLPIDWVREAGIDVEAWLARPVYDERIALLVERLLRTAGELYRRADFGVAMLPRDCRVAIRAARLIYGDIGRAIAANRYDSVNRRAVVSTARKLWLLVRALPARFEAAVPCNEPALPEVRFLIDACHLPSSTRSAKRAT